MTTSPAVKEDGQIVAIQYPEKVQFRNMHDAAELATKYGKLVSIDADSASQYTKLVAAVKAVSKARRHVDKEEKFFKDPANAFARLVLNHAKKVRTPFKTLEDNLKAEKKRVDDIQANKLEEQRKLHQSNLELIRVRGRVEFGAGLDALTAELEIIDRCNLDDFDFGELEEDAKAELANARVRTEQAIAMAERQKKLDDQEEQRKLDDAKRELEQAERDAYAEDEMREMKVKLAAAEAAAVPESEPADDGGADAISSITDADIANACGLPLEGANSSNKASPVQDVYQPATPAVNSFEDDEPAAKVICEDDLGNMNDFICKINELAKEAPIGFIDNDCAQAVNRVVDTLVKATGYLGRVAAGGDA